MEIYDVVGIRKVSFKTQDGKQVDGYSVYYEYTDENIEGIGCGKLFVSSAVWNSAGSIPLGTYRFYFNRYGKVSGYEPVKKA